MYRNMSPSRIADIYSGRSILITGASGFLGKVLVEKLLYSVPGISKIFIIVRSSKGQAPQERWKKITESAIFDRIKQECPERLEKVHTVEGDLMQENFGMYQHDIQQICEEVSIVFHCAATVKFDEVLRDAVEMNLRGTTRLVSLCHRMSKLACLVHTSTAYANCDRETTQEMVYPPPVEPQKLVEALDWMDDEMIATVTPKLLGSRPNTYTLTKALAESQLVEDAEGLPAIILRPSIVGAMWKDPIPGWTDNINGPTGIFAAVGKGVLTNMCGDVRSKADVVPVDIVSNMLIVAAAYRITTSTPSIPVMHCASGDLNPVYWGKIVAFLQQFYRSYPMEQCYGVPSTHFHTSRKLFLFNYYVKHHIPAQVLDALSGAVGRKRVFVRLYSKVWKMIETLHFFTTHGWLFESKALPMLWDWMHVEDKEVFNFDIRQLNWDSYLFDYVMGIKKFITKENVADFSIARANLAKQQRMQTIGQMLMCYALVRVVAKDQAANRKWAVWLASFFAAQTFRNYDYRPQSHLKSLEQYKAEQKRSCVTTKSSTC